VLGFSPLPRTLAAALRDVNEKRLEVRVSAVRDLGRHAREGEAEAVAGLMRVLHDDKNVAVRAEAAIALADAGPERAARAVPALTRAATGDEAIRVRQMALVALGELAGDKDRAAVDVIEHALRARAPELRFQALIALGHVKRADAVEAFYEHMDDENDSVRYVALRLVEERIVGDATKVELPERLRERALAALKDDAAKVRLAAAIVLARGGDESGREALVAAVNDGSGELEPEDEQTAIDLSGEFGLRDAIPGLTRRAFGLFGLSRDRFAWQARIALARLGDARARSAILRGLDAWSRDARTMAVVAAGRARLGDARAAIVAMRGKPERAAEDAVEEALQLLPEP
jgi:HEAT repeat protein